MPGGADAGELLLSGSHLSRALRLKATPMRHWAGHDTDAHS